MVTVPCLLIYIKNIITNSNTIEVHIDHLYGMLTSLKNACININIEKCKFLTIKVKYLGHIIKVGKLDIDHSQTVPL